MKQSVDEKQWIALKPIRDRLKRELAEAEAEGNDEKANLILEEMKSLKLYPESKKAHMDKVVYNPTRMKLRPNWGSIDLSILPIYILCERCKKPMNRGGMRCDLGYGENENGENSPEYDWLLLSCSDCDLEIAIPLRPVT